MDKIKYFLIGVIFIIVILIFISAAGGTGSPGKYQVTSNQNGVYVCDTETGAVKSVVSSMISKNFGKTFDELK